MTSSAHQPTSKTAVFLGWTKRLLVVVIMLLIIFLVESWLVWFQTRPVYDANEKASVTFLDPIVLYLFNTSPSNAVNVLRNGLMSELARSGALPKGYPKLTTLPWEDNQCSVISENKYYIQLSEVSENYIQLPLCRHSSQINEINIFILPASPWAKIDKDTRQIFIGFNAMSRYTLQPGQLELIFQALKDMGVKAYSD